MWNRRGNIETKKGTQVAPGRGSIREGKWNGMANSRWKISQEEMVRDI